MDAPPVQYVKTSDGYSIAYCVSGRGQPVVLLPFYFSNIQLAWQTAWARPLFEALASRFQLIQYDGRGQGMSTRGLPEHHSIEDYELDLDAVLAAVNPGPVVLYAESTHGHVGVRFAVKHPKRVRALILYDVDPDAHGLPESLEAMARDDWLTYLHVIGSSFAIEGSRVETDYLLQTTTPQDFFLGNMARQRSSIRGVLPLVTIPTLVLATRSMSKSGPPTRFLSIGQSIASLIPNASLVAIEGWASFFFGNDSEQPYLVTAIQELVAGLPSEDPLPVRAGPPGDLSSREVEVLRLLAAGRSNAQIAGELVISQNTVIRHVSNIFAKIGAGNRVEAATYAKDHGIA